MEQKNSKHIKLQTVLDHIHEKYGFEEFRAVDITEWVLKQSPTIAPNYFYALVSAKAVIKQGIHKNSPFKLDVYNEQVVIEAEKIYTQKQSQAEANRKLKKNKEKGTDNDKPPVAEIPSTGISKETTSITKDPTRKAAVIPEKLARVMHLMTEQIAIDYLKERHYKIHAPIIKYDYDEKPV